MACTAALGDMMAAQPGAIEQAEVQVEQTVASGIEAVAPTALQMTGRSPVAVVRMSGHHCT